MTVTRHGATRSPLSVHHSAGRDWAQLAAVTPQILDLVAKCAHGPSRPGGPLTAMAVGIAATRTDDFVAGVNAGIAAIEPLLDESDR